MQVKPNIGHSEGASGISGIIKAALSLEHATIPPNIFFETPSSRIPFEEAKMHVPTKALPWPSDRLERASINCFGIGGSNAHVIMDSTRMHLASAHLYETGQAITDQGTASAIDSKLLVVSASSAEALQQRIQQMTDFANNNPTTFSDLAYTLGCRREHLSHRAFAVGRPDKPVDMSSFQKSEPAAERQIVFVFTGQGAQWAGMGKSLIESFESFRSDIQSLDEVLHDLENPPCWSLEGMPSSESFCPNSRVNQDIEELVKPAPYSNINAAEFSQPLCTALQIGLVNLLKRMGVSPSSVVGHSSGEIAAAYASGAVSARTAILIAYFRGQAMKCSVRKGAMLAVGLGRDAVCCYLEDGVVIACENSPQSVTLSGDLEATLRVAEKIKKDLSDVPCRRLKVDTAYHSGKF
jgi:acyl transferase domain-containing protein